MKKCEPGCDFSTLAQLLSWLCPGRCPGTLAFNSPFSDLLSPTRTTQGNNAVLQGNWTSASYRCLISKQDYLGTTMVWNQLCEFSELALTGKPVNRETGHQIAGPRLRRKTTGSFVLCHGPLPQMCTLPLVALWHATPSCAMVRSQEMVIRELIWKTGEQDTDIISS